MGGGFFNDRNMLNKLSRENMTFLDNFTNQNNFSDHSFENATSSGITPLIQAFELFYRVLCLLLQDIVRYDHLKKLLEQKKN